MLELVTCKYNSNYLICSKGFVISLAHNKPKVLTNRLSKQGYLRVYLRDSDTNKRKDYRVHRLVAEHFLPNPCGYSIINHKDGDKTNNDVSNLEWCSQSHNIRHACDKGLCKPKYKPCVIDGVRYYSQSQAAQELGVCRHTIDNWIKEGRGYYIE